MNKLLIFLLIPLFSFSQAEVDLAEQYLGQKDYMNAELVLVDFVRTNQNHLKAIEFLGDAYGYQEKWDHAINQYKRLVDSKPEVANYHYKYGGALAMKALKTSKIKALLIIGDVKSAFLKAAELDKNHINTRWALVELYMQLPGIFGGSMSTSLDYAAELEALSKVDGYLAKGYIYEYDDEPELAETYYKMAIEEGGSLTCYGKLTDLYENQKQPDKAILNIEASQKKHQRNALHYQIGKIAAEYNIQLEKGEQCLRIYLKNYSPEDGVPKAWANYRLAQIFNHKANKEQALKYINLAIQELPNIDVFKDVKEQISNL